VQTEAHFRWLVVGEVYFPIMTELVVILIARVTNCYFNQIK